jgi:predicted GH43/DUF377 family glycosyl hydrolase
MWQPLMPYVNAGKPPEGWIGDTWDIWLTESKDLEYWGKPSRLLKTDQLEYANAKIGGGAPPIKTKEGWLCLIHGDDIDPRRGKKRMGTYLVRPISLRGNAPGSGKP